MTASPLKAKPDGAGVGRLLSLSLSRALGAVEAASLGRSVGCWLGDAAAVHALTSTIRSAGSRATARLGEMLTVAVLELKKGVRTIVAVAV
jgi:hypothetical protein